MLTPDDTAAPDAMSLPAGSTPPAPDMGGGAPAMPAAPAAPAPAAGPAKPSLFRGILEGALNGLAASSGAKTFSQGLVAGAAGDIRAQAAKKEMAMQQQQSDATTALHAVNTAKIMHDIHLMPDTKQEQYLNDSVDQGAALVKAGAITPLGAPGSRGDAQNEVLTLIKQNPGMVYSIQPVRGDDGSVKYQAVQYPHAPLQQDLVLKGLGPDGKDLTIPAGTPADQAGKYQSAALAKKLDGETKKIVEKQKSQTRLDVQDKKDATAITVQGMKNDAAGSKGGTKAQDMLFGTSPDGQQVAGSKEELAAAGVENAVKLPGTEAQKVVVARQLMTNRKGLFDLVDKDINNLSKQGKLGVAASRFGEFMSGKVGNEPDFAPLRTHMGLLATALMQAHVGARGSKDMLEHFKHLANYSISDEATLRAAINAEKEYVQEKAMMPGKGPAPAAASPSAPAGGQRRVIDLR